MANTKTNVQSVIGSDQVVQYFTLVCVSNAQETNTIIYSSSATNTAIQNMQSAVPGQSRIDPMSCGIYEVYATCSAVAAARISLNWDATTPVVALDLPPLQRTDHCFYKHPLPNQGGTGKTGNITLTTTGLTTGDMITIMLVVRPN